MTKRLEEEILLKVPAKKNGPSLTRLLAPGAGRRVAAAEPTEVEMPTGESIQMLKEIGDRRAGAVLAGRAPDLAGDELEALLANANARNERVSALTEAAYARIDRLLSDVKTSHGSAE